MHNFYLDPVVMIAFFLFSTLTIIRIIRNNLTVKCSNCGWIGSRSKASKKSILEIYDCPKCNKEIPTHSLLMWIDFKKSNRGV